MTSPYCFETRGDPFGNKVIFIVGNQGLRRILVIDGFPHCSNNKFDTRRGCEIHIRSMRIRTNDEQNPAFLPKRHIIQNMEFISKAGKVFCACNCQNFVESRNVNINPGPAVSKAFQFINTQMFGVQVRRNESSK